MYSVTRVVAVAVSVEWSPVCVPSLCVDIGDERVAGLENSVVTEDSVTVSSLGLLGGKVDDP